MIRFSLLVVLLGMLYLPLLPDLWDVWNHDPNYGHGIFVPLLAGVIAWSRRKQVLGQGPEPYGPGLILVFLGLVFYLLGLAGNEVFSMRSSLVVVMLGILLSLWGKKRTKALAFPVLYLLLMIPLPYVLYYAAAAPMKLMATKWAVWVMDLFRMSVYREGNIIHLPNTSLEVENACSGLRSLMALFAFGVVFACLAQRRLLARGILIGAIFPIALISNVLRIIATSLLAASRGAEAAQGFLHDTSGIVVYTVATVLLVTINEVIRRARKRRGAGPSVDSPLGG